ncbi:gamma-glutamylcyclotransferase family protein [Caenispirillum salinarum]|uniref:gamma-glutamylcyclotransferase family protein n=1 Tax=Caenispirillum salinarum TaxID=859058 RepID=UPI00384EF341
MRLGRTPFFAYGLFMHEARMRAVAPGHKALGRAVLDGWRVAVTRHGLATVTPDAPAAVEGLLWEIDAPALAALDRFEGVARGLYRKRTLPVTPAAAPANRVEALVYVAGDPPAPAHRARRDYADDLGTAAQAAGLSDPYIDTLRAVLAGRAHRTDTDPGGPS